MIFVLIKAQQASLFDAVVPVKGHATKTGVYVQPYQATRKKKAGEMAGAVRKLDRQMKDAWKHSPYEPDLFSDEGFVPEPEPQPATEKATKTLAQLIEIAAQAGLVITPNKSQTLARQRQAVLDELSEHGIKVDRPQAEIKIQQIDEPQPKPEPAQRHQEKRDGDSALIFGRDWEEIKRMQQKTDVRQTIDPSKPSQTVTEEQTRKDLDLLNEKGERWLRDNQMFGVIDRLQFAGYLEKPKPKPTEKPAPLFDDPVEPKPEPTPEGQQHAVVGMARALTGPDARLGDAVAELENASDKDWQHQKEMDHPGFARAYRSHYSDARLVAWRIRQTANKNPKIKMLDRIRGEALNQLLDDYAKNRYFEPLPETLKEMVRFSSPPKKKQKSAEDQALDDAYAKGKQITGETGTLRMDAILGTQDSRTVGTIEFDGKTFPVRLVLGGSGRVGISIKDGKVNAAVTHVAREQTFAHGMGALLAALNPEATLKLDMDRADPDRRVKADIEQAARRSDKQRQIALMKMRHARANIGGSGMEQPWDEADLTAYENIQRLEAKRFKGANDEKSLELNRERLKADPAKFRVGQGVSWNVGHGQINRGFQIIAIDAPTKLLHVRSVADTGLTSSGGDHDRISDEWVHAADLKRDRKYDSKR